MEFDGIKALSKVDFYVKKSECTGLLGTNGAGKSTIFQIMSANLHG